MPDRSTQTSTQVNAMLARRARTQDQAPELERQLSDLRIELKALRGRLGSLEMAVRQRMSQDERDETAVTKAAIIRLMKKLGMV